jgi:DNA polymerase III epsilon subunit-like protein
MKTPLALPLELPSSLGAYIFLDVEASGLHAGSYPIEVGWCGLDLVATSFLIRPHASWTEDDWSVTSERVHGITRQQVIAEGVDLTEAAARLNATCAGKEIITDSPSFDQGWLSRLFREAGISQTFTLQDASALEAVAAEISGLDASEAEALRERVGRHYPHTHRAAVDARRAASLFLAIALPDAVDAIIAAS